MTTKLILLLCCLVGFTVAEAAELPTFIQNPKLLVSPIIIYHAELYLDIDVGQKTGTFKDSHNQQLQFMVFGNRDELQIRRNPDYYGKIFYKAEFDGWTLEDFALLLEDTIRHQFTWDAEAKRLHIKDPKVLDKPEFARLTEGAARSLLLWAERKLKRKTSFMQ